jgi:hypothetical protein
MQDKEFEIIELAVEQHMKAATQAIIASILNISEAAGDHSEKPE